MKFYYVFIFILLALGSSCKFESRDTDAPDEKMVNEDNSVSSAEENENDSDEQLQIDFKQGELVPVSELKSLFPRKIGGLDRQSIKGESTGAFGFNLATVKSEFEDGKKEITLELIDFGGIPGVAQALAAWSKSDIFHEDEDGFEKVSEWKGHKSFEKSDTKDNNSSIALLYKNRFLISASARDISLDDLKEYLDDDFMDELDDLKLK